MVMLLPDGLLVLVTENTCIYLKLTALNHAMQSVFLRYILQCLLHVGIILSYYYHLVKGHIWL